MERTRKMVQSESADLLHFEDFPPGCVREFGERSITREDILAFATQFDPQPFHLDEEAAKASLLAGLAASGWHTFAIMMRLLCDDWVLRSTSMGSPGVQEAHWIEPVRPGDRLSIQMRVDDARPSRSRPEMGLLTLSTAVLNQKRTIVARTRHVHMIGRRERTPSTNVEAGAGPRRPDPRQEKPRPDAVSANGAPYGYLERVELGQPIALGEYAFHKDDMIRFARAFDPQPFHIDEQAAAHSHFNKLVASGWHVAGAFMRCLVDARQELEAQARARGETPPASGPSPGFTDMRWLKPTYEGDVLAFSTTPVAKRRTSRPGWGLLFSENAGSDQNGVRKFEYRSAVFYPTLPQA